jgi:hypothetical protein
MRVQAGQLGLPTAMEFPNAAALPLNTVAPRATAIP